MTDIVSKEKRSQMMSGIRGANTRPELLLRKALHNRGYRYKLHDRQLPGKPDIVFPKHRIVVLVNGCFWHKHNCHLFKMPTTRRDFWTNKINGNRERDLNNIAQLQETGWRVFVVWECAMKSKSKIPLASIADQFEYFISSEEKLVELSGTNPL